MKLFIASLIIISLLAFTGCGGQTTEEGEVADTSVEEQGEAPQAEGEIVLGEGWAMAEAVSPEEVEAIMGEPGFGVFSEASSSASSGRPVGSYNVSSIPYSKVRFEANVSGGQEAFDTAAGYLEERTEIDGSMWNTAVMGEVPAGDRTQMRILVLKGDLFVSVSWEPAVFPELDPEETSVMLAELLITNLYEN